MKSDAIVATLGISFFLCWRMFVVWKRRRDRSFLNSDSSGQFNLAHLVLASFTTMFLELALIRWIAVEIRIFAYIKNLALLLCFLGFGLGCALARKKIRWLPAVQALLGLLIVVRWPFYKGQIAEGLSQYLGAGSDLQIWGTAEHWDWISFLSAIAVTSALMLLVVYVFIPLGQSISHQMDLAIDSLQAYSWNLAGTLLGILVFFAAAWASLPPSVWLAGIFLALGLLQSTRVEQALVASLVLPAMFLLHDVTTPAHQVIWTPYQQIGVERRFFRSGDFLETVLNVNHTGYQSMVNLSAPFLQRHPKLLNHPIEDNAYNLPFRFSVAAPRVLIVGAGSGNDVAGALRNGGQSVDAVEIDPGIYKLGKQEHPEHPYDSPRVTVHLTDARAYLKRTHQQYDLILFGLLDSHTQLSDYSNMRIDNFVYTEESFREARALLSPDGIVFIKFQVNRDWLGQRLLKTLTQAFGKAPLVFFAPAGYSAGASCFVISNSNQVESRLAADSTLHRFVSDRRPSFLDSPEVGSTTDDWPYLYQQRHTIPRTYLTVAALVIVLTLFFYWRIPEVSGHAPSLFFFSMGAGFLLLETQSISRLALYFGTTWQVNGIVIGALLTTVLGANILMGRLAHPPRRSLLFAGLFVGLAIAYLIPVNGIPAPPSLIGWMLAAVFGIPVFFAGLIFAGEFRKAESPSAALGANILGAVLGGLLENLSLVFGMHTLLLIAAGLYFLAAMGRVSPRKSLSNEPAVR